MRTNTWIALVMSAALALSLGAAQKDTQKDPRAEAQLQAAITKETVEGDLKGAIELYQKLANGSNHAAAAKALVRMGQCYEKLGSAEATKAYERVVREFSDQKEAVEQARALLAAGGRDIPPETGIIAQQKWVPPPGRVTQMRRVSQDGRYISYTDIAGIRLYLHDLATGEDRLLLEDKSSVAFMGPAEISPEGRRMAYTRYVRCDNQYGGRDYELVIAGLDGSGPTVLVSEKERWIQPRAWSPDGKSILMSIAKGYEGLSLAIVSVADRSVRILPTPADYGSMGFSPDGRYIAAYRVSSRTGILPGALKLIPTDGSQEILLFESSAKNSYPFWTPDGRMIVFESDRSGKSDLWSLEVRGGKPQGEPRLVRSDIGPMVLLGFTQDGSLFYKTTVSPQGDIFVADLDPEIGLVVSKPERVNGRYAGSAGFPAAWSADGRFLAYTRKSPVESMRSKIISIMIREEATGAEREVAFVPATAFNQKVPFPNWLKWFPDGRSLLATDFNEKGKLVFRRIDAETGRVETFLDRSDENKGVFVPNLSQDGKTLYYAESWEGLYRLMRRNLENGEEKELYRTASPQMKIDDLSLSRDDWHLAFIAADMEGKTESLMILSAEGGHPRELFRSSEASISNLAWTKDGRHVLMVRYPKDGSSQVCSIPVEGGELRPSALAPRLTAVHPDGRRIVFYNSISGTEEVWVLKNLFAPPIPHILQVP